MNIFIYQIRTIVQGNRHGCEVSCRKSSGGEIGEIYICPASRVVIARVNSPVYGVCISVH
ncbi:MAG: hypothetical protein ACD_78C00330G0001, partial [uncultured bacterium (gcode 4)]